MKPARGLTALMERLDAACPPWNDRPMYEEIAHAADALRVHVGE
jgi:hypothetical protein